MIGYHSVYHGAKQATSGHQMRGSGATDCSSLRDKGKCGNLPLKSSTAYAPFAVLRATHVLYGSLLFLSGAG
jgi:hypothetical protein